MQVRIMICPCNKDLWICILYFQQRLNFPFECFLPGNVIRYLYVYLFIPSDSDKIYLFFIQHAYIKFIAATQKFYGDDVFVHMAIIHIASTQARIPKGMIRQIKFIFSREVFFSTDIISANPVKGKGPAQVFHIAADSLVVRIVSGRIKRFGHIPYGRNISHIVHQKSINFSKKGLLRILYLEIMSRTISALKTSSLM